MWGGGGATMHKRSCGVHKRFAKSINPCAPDLDLKHLLAAQATSVRQGEGHQGFGLGLRHVTTQVSEDRCPRSERDVVNDKRY